MKTDGFYSLFSEIKALLTLSESTAMTFLISHLPDASVSTTTPKFMDSSTRVFAAVELLTQILESCAVFDLLHLTRVNRTFRKTISTSKTIQTKLFFLPREESLDTIDTIAINPFMQLLAFQQDEVIPPGCDYDNGPALTLQEDLDLGDDRCSQDGDWRPDTNPTIFLEFDWGKVSADTRFTRESASWKRMLVSQPPSREVWNYRKDGGAWSDYSDGQTSRDVMMKKEGGKRVGTTWEDVQRARANPSCQRLRTFVRTSERLKVVVFVNVEIKPIHSEEDSETISMASFLLTLRIDGATDL